MSEYKKIATSVALLGGVVNAVSPSLQTSASLTSFLKKAGSTAYSVGYTFFNFIGIVSLVKIIKDMFVSSEKSNTKELNEDTSSGNSTDGSSEGGNDAKNNSKKDTESRKNENVEEEIVLYNDESEDEKKEKELNLNENLYDSFDFSKKCMEIFNNPKKFKWHWESIDGKNHLYVDIDGRADYVSASRVFAECKKKLEEELRAKSAEDLNKVIKEQIDDGSLLFGDGDLTLKQKIEDDIDVCNFMIFASVDNPWGVVNMKSPSLINFSTPFFRNLSEFFRNSEEKEKEKKKDEKASSLLGNVILGEKFRGARLVRNWAINKVSNNGERQFSEIEVVQKIVSRYKKEKNDELLNVKNCIDDGLGYSTTEMYNDFKQFLKDMKLEDELRDLEKSEEDDNVVKKRLKDLEDFEKQYRNSNKNT